MWRYRRGSSVNTKRCFNIPLARLVLASARAMSVAGRPVAASGLARHRADAALHYTNFSKQRILARPDLTPDTS